MIDYDFGTKIFILYPNTFIRNEIVIPLIDREYEIYLFEDHNLISKINRRFKNAILFINIDQKLTASQWEKLIVTNRDIKIGVLTYNDNQNMEMKYTKMLKVPCGYTALRQRPDEIVGKIAGILDSYNAKENRKFIRTRFENTENLISFVFSENKKTGYIYDLSSVGMTIIFNKAFKIEKHKVINDIQLNIKESIITISAVFLGIRKLDDGKVLYVFIFDKSVKKMIRSRLRLLINRVNQNRMLSTFQVYSCV